MSEYYKPRTRWDCIKRYGEIDFEARHWPRQSEWITVVDIPPDYNPNWTVLDTKRPVKRIACNKDMAKPLWHALQAVKTMGLEKQLQTFDGCLAIRNVRGSNMFSAHSYGLAIDLNARKNLMSKILRTNFSPAFVKCFTDQGFKWGGNFNGRKDPMHFSWSWE